MWVYIMYGVGAAFVTFVTLVTVTCCRVGAKHDATLDDEESGFLLKPILKRKRRE